MLLPSGPDTVRGSPLRGTRSSTSRRRAAFENGDLERGFSPAGADCRLQGTASSPPSTAREGYRGRPRSWRSPVPGEETSARGIRAPRRRRSRGPERAHLRTEAITVSPPRWWFGRRRGRAPERAHPQVRERGAEAPTNARAASAAGGCGGEGGIRTRDGLPQTAFPVRRHSPLGDLSPDKSGPAERADRSLRDRGWRRGRDSNPRCFRTPLFESGTINHSDTSPPERIPNPRREPGCGARSALSPGLPLPLSASVPETPPG